MIYEKNDEYCLTQQGTMGWTMIQGYGIESVTDLKALKERGPLYENHPPIATYLRNRFVSNPDFRTLFEVLLRRGGDQLSIQKLCTTLIDSYPTTFVNLVDTDSDDDRDAPYLIEQGRGDEIYEDPDYLKQLVHSQFISNTASQFKSLGVLDRKSPVIEPKSKLNPKNDYWLPKNFQLGYIRTISSLFECWVVTLRCRYQTTERDTSCTRELSSRKFIQESDFVGAQILG